MYVPTLGEKLLILVESCSQVSATMRPSQPHGKFVRSQQFDSATFQYLGSENPKMIATNKLSLICLFFVLVCDTTIASPIKQNVRSLQNEASPTSELSDAPIVRMLKGAKEAEDDEAEVEKTVEASGTTGVDKEITESESDDDDDDDDSAPSPASATKRSKKDSTSAPSAPKATKKGKLSPPQIKHVHCFVVLTLMDNQRIH